VIESAAMVAKIRAAVAARRDPDFVIIARTDAHSVEGFDAAVARARAYRTAGADMIFPEAMESADEFARFAAAVDAPLLANMTEFGRSPLLDARRSGRHGLPASSSIPDDPPRAPPCGPVEETRSTLERDPARLLGLCIVACQALDLIGYTEWGTATGLLPRTGRKRAWGSAARLAAPSPIVDCRMGPAGSAEES
jgi:methylisocitrate lyase